MSNRRPESAEPSLAPVILLAVIGTTLILAGMAISSAAVALIGLAGFGWATVLHCRRHG